MPNKKKGIDYRFTIDVLKNICYADSRISGRRKLNMLVKEKERLRYDVETIKVDGIEPTPEMKELLEKQRHGEITMEEIRDIFNNRGYKMKP